MSSTNLSADLAPAPRPSLLFEMHPHFGKTTSIRV
jgi:hypothetical protein